MPEWVIAIISVVIGTLLGFGLNLWRDKRQQNEERKLEALKVHFDTLNEEIIEKLYYMSSSLEIQHNELIFKSSEKVIGFNLSEEEIPKSEEPVLKHYKFEDDEIFLGFEVHFPERAQEWNQLKREAVTLKSCVDVVARGESGNKKVEYENARQQINDYFFPLQEKFKDFAQRLNMEVETIGKYQIGTGFKYSKKCPICKKF